MNHTSPTSKPVIKPLPSSVPVWQKNGLRFAVCKTAPAILKTTTAVCMAMLLSACLGADEQDNASTVVPSTSLPPTTVIDAPETTEPVDLTPETTPPNETTNTTPTNITPTGTTPIDTTPVNEPVMPVAPTIPVAPITPAAPITPVEPTTPSIPVSNPVNPTPPVTTPTTPANPVTPVDTPVDTPTQPEPTRPVMPVEPTTPEEPTEPVEPVAPEPNTPVEPTEPNPPVTPIDNEPNNPAPFIPGQPLLNSSGSFNDGRGGFSATLKGNNNVTWNEQAVFVIADPQPNPWNIQLKHPLNATASYRISVCFRASANTERSIKIDMDDGAPNFNSLISGGERVTITTETTPYAMQFDITANSSSARLKLNLGGEAGTVTLDDIHVVTGDDCPNVATPPAQNPVIPIDGGNGDDGGSDRGDRGDNDNGAAEPPTTGNEQPSYASGGNTGRIADRSRFPCAGCLLGLPDNYTHDNPTPLLILLHGDEGRADFIHNRYHSRDAIAKKEGFIVASLKCPDEFDCNNTDTTSELTNFRAKNSWWLWERYEQKYDPEWINRQVDKIEREYNIDRRKVYFAGFSGGSVLLSTWGFENSDRYAGMILSGGGAVAKTYRNCATRCQIPVYISIGKNDSLHRSATLTRDQANRCGHEVEFSEHENVGHVYIQQDLDKIMQWFKDRPHQCIR